MAGFVIAIDGPAASGKGTIAEGLGRAYGFPVLDSGLLYRAVGVTVRRQGGDPADPETAEAAARALDPSRLDDPSFRAREAGEAASLVAAHPGVRDALLNFQRRFAAQEPGAVIDGRDIGTVIAPGAPAKLFVTASAEIRAERRYKQLIGNGEAVAYEDILADIRRRDERDSGRAASPLVRAEDAALLDTSEMSISQAADAARRIVEQARARWETSQEKFSRQG
jgi:CMP/dCMP kinase